MFFELVANMITDFISAVDFDSTAWLVGHVLFRVCYTAHGSYSNNLGRI